jgi:hypothetical protein
MTNSPVSDEAQVGDPVVAVQAGVGEKEAEVMSGETEDQKRIEEVAEALENRLRANPIQQPNGKLSGWKAAGIVAAVLTAIATPVLTITWFMSSKMQSLDGACDEIKDINVNMGRVRQDVQRLREAFIAHTQQMLPYLVMPEPPQQHQPSPPHDLPPSSRFVEPRPMVLDSMTPTMSTNVVVRPDVPQQPQRTVP